jgi:hypothetical protein
MTMCCKLRGREEDVRAGIIQQRNQNNVPLDV